MKKRILAMLLTLSMLFTLLPTGAFAASSISTLGDVKLYFPNTLKNPNDAEDWGDYYDPTDYTVKVGKSGNVQNLQVFTMTCNYDGTLLVDEHAKLYVIPSVEISNSQILKSWELTLSGYKSEDAEDLPYEGIPCLDFVFTGAKPGKTMVEFDEYIYVNPAPSNQTPDSWIRCSTCQSTYGLPVFAKVHISFGITVTEDYSLSYDANGGDGAPRAETKTTSAEEVTFTVSSTEPTRDGYTFLGWADTTDAALAPYQSGDKITLKNGAPAKTIYAVWEEKIEPDTTYTLTYDANSGSGAPDAQAESNNTGSAKFTVSSDKPTREGYEFKGWADNANATEATYQGGDEITLSKDAPDKTIYAVWEKIESSDIPPVDPTDWDKLEINKTADKTEAKPGDTVTYTITVTNNTGKDLTDVEVTDVLNENLTFVSADSDYGDYDKDSGVWNIGALANATTATLTIKATVSKDAAADYIITNEATITGAKDEDGNELPPDGENHSSSAYVSVSPTPVGPGGDDGNEGGDTPDTPSDPGTSGGSGDDGSWVLPALAVGAAVAVPVIIHHFKNQTPAVPAEGVEEVPPVVVEEEIPVVPDEVVEAQPVPKTGDATHPIALALGGAAMLALGGALGRKRREDDRDGEQ